MSIDTNKLFWNFIKESGEDCININKTRRKYKKSNKNYINLIDDEYNKNLNFLKTKLDTIIGDSFDYENDAFNEFYLHILSKGESNFNKIIDNDYKKKYHVIPTYNYDLQVPIKEHLYNKKSEYQLISVLDTDKLGKVLVIDGDFQFSEKDEHIYHEMMAHVPINYFENNINKLIIGGGDGGIARESLKHNNIIKIDLVDIDKEVVEVSKKYFPKISSSYDNPKLELTIGDGMKFVESTNNKYDIISLDLTDYNQSDDLRNPSFYKKLKKIMTEKSLIVWNFTNIEEDSPFIDILSKIKNDFKYMECYNTTIQSFGGGTYTFCLLSDTIDIKNKKIDWNLYKSKNIESKYYSPKIHLSSFIFPKSIEDKLAKIH